MIIDCHGHYTTAPKALENWRNQQIAGIKEPAARPRVFTNRARHSQMSMRQAFSFKPSPFDADDDAWAAPGAPPSGRRGRRRASP